MVYVQKANDYVIYFIKSLIFEAFLSLLNRNSRCSLSLILLLMNIKILDLSRMLPGPYCTMILSDLGANIIRVEDPKYPYSNPPPFYQKGKYIEGLNEIRKRCVAEGDYFLYQRLTKILKQSPSTEEWIQLGDNALAQGKLLFARSAYQQADNSGKVAEVEKLLQLSTQESQAGKKVLH